jgi:hypothetical protein
MDNIQFPLISAANPVMLRVFCVISAQLLASNAKMYLELITFTMLMAVF